MRRRTFLQFATSAFALATTKRFADEYAYKFDAYRVGHATFMPPLLQAQLFSIGRDLHQTHVPFGPVVEVAPDGTATFLLTEKHVPTTQEERDAKSRPHPYYASDGLDASKGVVVHGVVLIIDGKPLPGHKFSSAFVALAGQEVAVLQMTSTYPGYVPETFASVLTVAS